ncbi:hypothetical protein CEW81_22775 [Kluyvera genomosp. 3]|uniref:Retention module-containing protein n=1 Tax=Kluyvera genomosp. 3 TaxID=2774055 RepID=A0A248KLP5_9ENTR|nr:hypothetical protein CEW81_22775 [Kluyvera genomosp. 3]
MNGIAGIIKAIIGQVFAISPDGTRRLLVEGDKLLAGEQIETGANGAVTLALPDGKTLDLGRDSHWDGGHGIANTPDATDTTDIAAIQQAIADGQDPTQILEATAAGHKPRPAVASPAQAVPILTLSWISPAKESTLQPDIRLKVSISPIRR